MHYISNFKRVIGSIYDWMTGMQTIEWSPCNCGFCDIVSIYGGGRPRVTRRRWRSGIYRLIPHTLGQWKVVVALLLAAG